jgi:hypothetical protein
MQMTNDTTTYTIVIPIAFPPSDLADVQEIPALRRPCLAGALNSSEPIKKPHSHRTSDVKNHPTDFDL